MSMQQDTCKQHLGVSVDVELKGCSLDLIQCESHLQEYVEQALKHLGAEPYGACVAVHHGSHLRDRGYSVFQLTQSFSLSAHFVDAEKTGFINVFSDRPIDEGRFAEFSKSFFEASQYHLQKNLRF